MLTTEFNMEDAIAVWKEEGREEGREEGLDILARFLREGLSLEEAVNKAKKAIKNHGNTTML